jgi:ParB family chromosome partitioning protein
MAKMKGLGRGLDALLGGDEPAVVVPAAPDRQSELRTDQLQPGKYQPRTHMDDTALKELAASIKAQGIMQPILVRPVAGGCFEIIAGERRWRAARIAGLETVPVLVREVADNAALAMALIENIQREDLNPLEQAVGIQRLVNEFGATHDQAADMVGRSRSAVTNLLRLLGLAAPVRELLQQGKLDMGHARALLALMGMQQIEAARVARN